MTISCMNDKQTFDIIQLLHIIMYLPSQSNEKNKLNFFFFGFVRERERKRRETEVGVVGIVRDMGVIGERGPEEDRAFRGTGGETPQ